MNVLYVASAKAKAPAVQEYLETLLVRSSIKPWHQIVIFGIKPWYHNGALQYISPRIKLNILVSIVSIK